MKRTNDPPMVDEFTMLYRLTYPRVIAYVRRRSQLDAESVAAEVYAIAWAKRRTALDLGLPWLYRTAYLEIQNQRRSDLTARKPQPLAVRPPPPDHAEESTQHVWLRSLLQQLSPQDQELLRLLYWEDLDHHAAAIAMGCRAGAVTVRAHRARKRLERLISQQTAAPPLASQHRPPGSAELGTAHARQTGATRP